MSTKIKYATDMTLGRIVDNIKKLSSVMQKRSRLVAFSATFDYCLLRILRLSVSLSWKIIPIVQ
jgi:hypothetical protein